jgi:hypothetical protein
MTYAGNNLDKAREVFAAAMTIKENPKRGVLRPRLGPGRAS